MAFWSVGPFFCPVRPFLKIFIAPKDSSNLRLLFRKKFLLHQKILFTVVRSVRLARLMILFAVGFLGTFRLVTCLQDPPFVYWWPIENIRDDQENCFWDNNFLDRILIIMCHVIKNTGLYKPLSARKVHQSTFRPRDQNKNFEIKIY